MITSISNLFMQVHTWSHRSSRTCANITNHDCLCPLCPSIYPIVIPAPIGMCLRYIPSDHNHIFTHLHLHAGLMSSASTPCLASSSIIHHQFFFPNTSRPLPLPLGRSTTQPYLYRDHTFTSKAVPLWATQDDFRGKERERERGGGT